MEYYDYDQDNIASNVTKKEFKGLMCAVEN